MRYAKWPHYPHGHITHLSPIYFLNCFENNFKLEMLINELGRLFQLQLSILYANIC